MDPYLSRTSLSRLVKASILVAGVLAASVVPSAAFAKGKPDHGGGNTSGTGICWVSPNPVPLGAQYDISGSGFAPNEILQQWTISSLATSITFVGADASGNFTGATGWANHSGAYTVEVKDSASGAIKATCSFTIS
ncbi:MAG TPA: hypothetical protein VFW71_11570 [Actinomycetota bacterium]|nr:hypothetical protein [Actinomycetota bacterium]